MKTLIVYCSKYGTTEKCAELIKEKLEEQVSSINLQSNPYPDIKDFDVILIGGSIYAGKIQKEVKGFVKANEEELLKRNLGLFLSCGQAEKTEEYQKDVFTEKIYDHAFVKVNVGYGYIFEKMGIMSRLIVKKLAKINKTTIDIKYDNIEHLIEKVNGLGSLNG